MNRLYFVATVLVLIIIPHTVDSFFLQNLTSISVTPNISCYLNNNTASPGGFLFCAIRTYNAGVATNSSSFTVYDGLRYMNSLSRFMQNRCNNSQYLSQAGTGQAVCYPIGTFETYNYLNICICQTNNCNQNFASCQASAASTLDLSSFSSLIPDITAHTQCNDTLNASITCTEQPFVNASLCEDYIKNNSVLCAITLNGTFTIRTALIYQDYDRYLTQKIYELTLASNSGAGVTVGQTDTNFYYSPGSMLLPQECSCTNFSLCNQNFSSCSSPTEDADADTTMTTATATTATTMIANATATTGTNNTTAATATNAITVAAATNPATVATATNAITATTGTNATTGATGTNGITAATATNSFTAAAGTNAITAAAATNTFTAATGTNTFTAAAATNAFTAAATTNATTGATGTNAITAATGTNATTGATATNGITAATATNTFTAATGTNTLTAAATTNATTGATATNAFTAGTGTNAITAAAATNAFTAATGTNATMVATATNATAAATATHATVAATATNAITTMATNTTTTTSNIQIPGSLQSGLGSAATAGLACGIIFSAILFSAEIIFFKFFYHGGTAAAERAVAYRA